MVGRPLQIRASTSAEAASDLLANAGLTTTVARLQTHASDIAPAFVLFGCASQLVTDDQTGQGTFDSLPGHEGKSEMPLRTNRGSSISAPHEVAPKENKATSAATPARRNSAPAALEGLRSRSPLPAAESRAPVGRLDQGRLNAFNDKFRQSVLPQRQQATAGSQLHTPNDPSRPVTLGNVKGDELDTKHRPTPLVQDNGAGGIWKKPGSQNGATGKFNFASDENNNVFVGKEGQGVRHPHLASSLDGRPTYAGEVVLQNGKVNAWNNNSGHFRPPANLSHQAPFPADRFSPQHIRNRIQSETGNSSMKWSVADQADAQQRVAEGRTHLDPGRYADNKLINKQTLAPGPLKETDDIE
ncbi:hypothetical protein PQR29_00720 [Paraburkholderia strydomiana]|uniref:hypothetical protein n=1 Tax=Paraburkholderia strydomiana TaxID=1245417 RepID=UPI0038B959E4